MLQRARSTRLHFLAVPALSVGLFLSSVSTASFNAKGCRNVQLSAFRFVSPSAGWAQGSCASQPAILRTTDGGKTWVDVTSLGLRPFLMRTLATEFLDTKHVWVAGQASALKDVVFRTSDGGKNWQRTLLRVADSRFDAPALAQPYFLNEREGWLGTAYLAMNQNIDQLYQTSNGGATWVRVDSGLPISGLLGFQTPMLGYGAASIAGEGLNLVYRSLDGGRHWNRYLFPLPPAYRRVHVAVDFRHPQLQGTTSATLPTVIEPLSLRSHPSLIVYRTKDSGLRWSRGAGLNLPYGGSSTSWTSKGRSLVPEVTVSFVDLNEGWAATARGLYRTLDAGETWAKIETNISLRHGYGLDFVSARVGFVLVWNKNSQSLMRTSDGGKTWATEEQMPG